VKSTIERIKPTRVKINIVASPDDLRPSIDHAYEHIGEDVSIPGFRKGKVPPALLEKRVGRGAILAHAINDALDVLYRQAIEEHKIRPLSQPSADVKEAPSDVDFSGDLVVEIEVEARPEIKLPKYQGLKVTVSEIKVAPIEVDAEVDALRGRFGSLKTVDRPAKKGDFTTINLSAEIDGKVIDTAENISYEIGSGNLLDGIDEALDTLTAGESTTFVSKLVGGEMSGADAQVSVTLTAVKERELPKLDDEFAKLYSEFDTVKELKAGLEAQIARSKGYTQGIEARDKATDALLELVDIPVSDELIEADVNRHLEGEGRLEDKAHRAEVTEQSARSFKVQMLLDAIAEAEELKVSEQELIQYLMQAAQQYGMDINEFIKVVDQNGQIPMFVAEVARRKALAVVLEAATVVDTKGKKVDLEDFLKTDDAGVEDHTGHDHD
jgi:trigger factor